MSARARTEWHAVVRRDDDAWWTVTLYPDGVNPGVDTWSFHTQAEAVASAHRLVVETRRALASVAALGGIR